MSEIKNGEPAFPRNYNSDGHNGMSLRDYFAAKAMQGLLANPWVAERFGMQQDLVSQESYVYAGAMLRARDTPNTESGKS